jgi:hypothetical protein
MLISVSRDISVRKMIVGVGLLEGRSSCLLVALRLLKGNTQFYYKSLPEELRPE